MLEKLGFMKIEKCSKEVNAIKNEYDKKIDELRKFIEGLEVKNSNLRDENLRFKTYEGRNFKLENDITKLKKENENLKKAVESRSYIGLDNKIAWSVGEWK